MRLVDFDPKVHSTKNPTESQISFSCTSKVDRPDSANLYIDSAIKYGSSIPAVRAKKCVGPSRSIEMTSQRARDTPNRTFIIGRASSSVAGRSV